ncbi:MAG TPA: capsular biosynthesis protein [Usitatibacter sp.]|nr:capsular biosynthesis protein [Usitatibacter sp.]
MARRAFLLLQGVCSPFFARLADELQAAGHAVLKLNFNAGDALYWARRPGWHFRGTLDELGEFLETRYARHGITDQVMFGDCRPVHRCASACAARNGVRTHVFEEGYFRPYWITLESEGANGRSRLPRDPGWFRHVARLLPPTPVEARFAAPYRVRAFHDVAYHVAGSLNPILYPHYRTHSATTAPVEYAAYVRRLAWLKLNRRREEERVRSLAESGIAYFVLALQLNGDAQVRAHSRFRDMGEVVNEVMASFASYAPPACHLAIKNHPLDEGHLNHGRIVRREAHGLGLGRRVHYLEAGDLATLVAHSKGLVTVNSTSGLAALEHGKPTIVLGNAIYDLPGMTAQVGLDEFWRRPQPPDPQQFESFRKVVLQLTQVNGGLYCRGGMALAAKNSCAVLIDALPRLQRFL